MCGGEKEIAHDCEILTASSQNLKIRKIHCFRENAFLLFCIIEIKYSLSLFQNGFNFFYRYDVPAYFPCQILRWKTLQTVTLIFQDLSANWTWMWCAHDYLNEHLQNKINCVWRRLKFTENFRRYSFRFEEDAKYISFSACLFK